MIGRRTFLLFLSLTAAAFATPGLTMPARAAAALSQGQLDAALAPIALYPDALLTPLLMATTYPDEMIAADGWLQKARNARLKGDKLEEALARQPWDPAVKALVPFPQIVDMLANRPVWMRQIGEAFLNDPVAVMREIQRLRRAALATGKLKSSSHLKVSEAAGEVVIAAPAAGPLYIPVYNPAVVYGAWAYDAYPPVYIQPPPGFHASGPPMETGVGFSRGFAELNGLWGWAHADWRTGAVTLAVPVYNKINRYAPPATAATWHHAAHPPGYFKIPVEADDKAHGKEARNDARGRAEEHHKGHDLRSRAQRRVHGRHRPATHRARHATRHRKHRR